VKMTDITLERDDVIIKGKKVEIHSDNQTEIQAAELIISEIRADDIDTSELFCTNVSMSSTGTFKKSDSGYENPIRSIHFRDGTILVESSWNMPIIQVAGGHFGGTHESSSYDLLDEIDKLIHQVDELENKIKKLEEKAQTSGTGKLNWPGKLVLEDSRGGDQVVRSADNGPVTLQFEGLRRVDQASGMQVGLSYVDAEALIAGYSKALESNPDGKLWASKGILLRAVGHKAEAETAFAKAKELGYQG
jgi:hypothetical protein